MSRSALYPSAVIGHRGAAALAPENTLASIRRAAADGAGMVEVDVKLTADGRPIVMHDDRLERTTDGIGAVASTTLDALGALDAGAWFAPEFTGATVPTLEELLETVLDLGIGLNIEIKPCPARDVETTEAILAAAGAMWPDDRPPPLLSSFSRECLARARDITRSWARDWPRALIADALPGDWTEARLILDLAAVHLGSDGLEAGTIAGIHAGGSAVAVWTVNDIDRARALWAAGVDAVITDDPGRLASVAPTGGAAEPSGDGPSGGW